jgi:DNA polymerase III subunit gamma/tau
MPAKQPKKPVEARPDKREALANKYRPREWAAVIGQDAQVRAFRGVLDKGTASTFLLTGPSGCGKTTIARIAAEHLGVSRIGLTEVDAASNTGVDNMRAICEPLDYRPLDGSARAVIVDECHMLSKSAWNSILKVTEEPQPDVYWFFCTTEPGKVPDTIKTRCAKFTLKELERGAIVKLLEDVADDERMEVSDAIIDMIAKKVNGSARDALMCLAVCDGVKDRREAAELLETVANEDQVIELCRLLVGRGTWPKAMGILGRMGETNAESVRIVVCNYMASCIKGAKSDKEVPRLLNILDAFSQAYNSSERMAPLYLSMGRVFFR